MIADKSLLTKLSNLDFISSISRTITPRNFCCVTSPSLSVSATVSLSLLTSKPMVAVNIVYYNRAHTLLQECEWKWLANRSVRYILLNHKVIKWDRSLYACRCVRACTWHLSLLPEMREWVRHVAITSQWRKRKNNFKYIQPKHGTHHEDPFLILTPLQFCWCLRLHTSIWLIAATGRLTQVPQASCM